MPDIDAIVTGEQAAYKISRRLVDGAPRSVLGAGSRFVDIGKALGDERYADMQVLLDQWFELEPRLQAIADAAPTEALLGEQPLLLSPLKPQNIFCVGANYRDHLLEMLAARGVVKKNWTRNLDARPWFFLKSNGCVADPNQDIPIASFDWNLDWEVELAAVIGLKTFRVSVENALDSVAGYTIANDLSARGRLRRHDVAEGSPFIYDWVGHKVFDGSCPLGPWITPSSQVGDPQSLDISLSVNGEKMQESSTSEMIFSLAEQIAELSATLTLQPGDVLLTGTPAGVGSARNRFLRDGDLLEASIAGMGTLRNRLVQQTI